MTADYFRRFQWAQLSPEFQSELTLSNNCGRSTVSFVSEQLVRRLWPEDFGSRLTQSTSDITNSDCRYRVAIRIECV